MDDQVKQEPVVYTTPTAKTGQSYSSLTRLIIVGIIMFLLGLGGGYILFSNKERTVTHYPVQNSPTMATHSETGVPSVTPLPLLHISPAQTNNWLKYVDSNFHYSFMYAPTWKLSPPISSNKNLSDTYLGLPRYVSYLQIKNTLSPNDSDLSIAVELNNNSNHLSLEKWVNNTLKNSSIVYQKESFTINGNEAIRTRRIPSFENVFINYKSPDKTKDLFIEIRFMGNGEGSSKFYQDNGPFVQQEWPKFEALVNSLTFSQ